MVKPRIVVLRYGHRFERDYRVTSHCCLVARAFGAEKVFIAGDEDQSIKESVGDIAERWGGKFEVEFTGNWKKTLKELKGKGYFVAHLTMYGLPVQKEIAKIRKRQKILVVIGSQKVEREVYRQSDANISVTSQPHSEIAALAVFLDRLQQGKELEKKFPKAKIKVLPQKNGKKISKR